MKFDKELRSRMVPEWQEAYMDYDNLKKLLSSIHNFRLTKEDKPNLATKKGTLHRSFSALIHGTSPLSTPTSKTPSSQSQPISVRNVRRDGVDYYQTTFLMAADEGGEYDVAFFRKLDEEFNKVQNFYKSKVEEVTNEARMLNKQINAFIAFRIKVDDPRHGFKGDVELNNLAADVAASTAVLSANNPSSAEAGRRFTLDVIEEGSSNKGKTEEDEELQEIRSENLSVKVHKPESIKGFRPAPLEILNHVKMNTTMETPVSTISGLLNIPLDQTEMKFTKEKLKKIEKQLKRAFFEFYQKLRLLKSFSFLNVLAFSKIMKKYDKIASKGASRSYMTMVDNSHLGNSDEVTKLMGRTEGAFIKQFSKSNRSKGMSILKPKTKRQKHRITFTLGFFLGTALALILAIALTIRTRRIIHHEGQTRYLDTMLPLYTFFGFIVLHMLLYAGAIYFWRRYRVNYVFIFGFKEGTDLGYIEVSLLGCAVAVLGLAMVLANLDVDMDPRTGDYKVVTELLPLALLVLLGLILICPFNVIYRSSRIFLLTCAFHCIFAPLYKVALPDFFLADQLTSQVEALRNLEFYICHYAWGNFRIRENNCTTTAFNTFLFIIAAVPYWLRLLQCLRRLFEEKDIMQGMNGLKYFSAIVAIACRTAFSLNRGIGWRIVAWVASAIAMIFGIYWDLVIDWGLLQRKSKNRWLRDKLVIPHNSVYFAAMVVNVVLRLAWLQTVLIPAPRFLHRRVVATLVACLEIVRRGIWNFFRLENEHLNNVGKYRAFNSVPLPFNYHEDEEKDE